MKLNGFSIVIASTFLGALGACGSGTTQSAPPPAGATDAGIADAAPPVVDEDAGDTAPPGPDHGAPSDTYPAFKPEMAQIVTRGGAVLKNPQIVTITWPGDDLAPNFEAFGDNIGTTQYWPQVVGEYGVGAAVSGPTNHVHMTSALPTGVTDSQLDTIVSANASQKAVTDQDGNTFSPDATVWPTPNANTLYIMYIPASSGFVLSDGQGGSIAACDPNSQVGGYHSATADDGSYVYAVIPECGARGNESLLDVSTESASHELAEASIDPQPGYGYYGLDADHSVWSIYNARQTENGDMCEFYRDSFYKDNETDFTFQVQRQWSNKSAAAGHAPCAPVPPGAYFNTTPLDLETINVRNKATKGYKLVVGQARTFEIGFYSDMSTEPWTITLHEGNPEAALLGETVTSNLTFSVDKTTGQNGEKAVVTVKMKTAPTASQFPYLVVTSRQGSESHDMPIMVSTK